MPVHTVSTMKTLLETRNDAVEKGLLVIYDRQTDSEQAMMATTEANGRGFSAFDAEFLSSLAEQIKQNRYRQMLGARLTPKQLLYARKKMLKYAGQLAKVANEREARIERTIEQHEAVA